MTGVQTCALPILDLPVGKIVTAFVENGLEVSEVHTCEESLEDYFKRVTGGEGIA